MSATESRDTRAAKGRTPVFASIAARVLELAAAEGLDTGARLPAERELARRLGVSRTSLREALTALRIEGAIEVQHGNGIYLLHPPTETIPPIAIELARANPGLPAPARCATRSRPRPPSWRHCAARTRTWPR